MRKAENSFFDKRIADRCGPTRNEANAIRELLHGNINHTEAATRFTNDISESRTAEASRESLWGMWKLLEDTARKFPEHHDKLVNLVDAIRQLPDLVIRGETAVRWPELPILAWSWTENVFDRDVSAYSEDQISITAFTAWLCARQLVDFLSAAEFDFYVAFEKDPQASSALKAGDIQRLNVNVPVAAQWILHAGEAIYNCEESFDLEARDGLWTGQPGFSYDRWKLWKERAEWVCGLNKVVRRETVEVARKMVERMNEIEDDDS
ncbi:hypothetical protein F5Y04DRAFT_276472 [Hypomontagnella monticulosa]|nr:hypothetical protein F5Y04DRAFT_276472 [Hypomontagnella monticulosa]